MSFEPRRAEHPSAPAPRLAAVLAAAVLGAAGLALVHEARIRGQATRAPDDAGEARAAPRTIAAGLEPLAADKAEASAPRPAGGAAVAGPARHEGERAAFADGRDGPRRDNDTERPDGEPAPVSPAPAQRPAQSAAPRSPSVAAPAEPRAETERRDPPAGNRPAWKVPDAAGRALGQGEIALSPVEPGRASGAEPDDAGVSGKKRASEERVVRRSPRAAVEAPAPAAPRARTAPGARPPSARGPEAAARHYLAARETLEGLALRDATGYWSNTYVPGDPVLRVLAARLAHGGTELLPAALERTRPNWQPFDPPRDAGLALYVHADKAAVEGRSRLRVQVGLQATARRSGQRPAMNVGVVLDLRATPAPADLIGMRALVSALARARRPGDRFSLTVAGRGDAPVVGPEDFRHGPLQLALQRLFAGQGGRPAGGASLLAALRSAASEVRRGDDPAAPLGASLVLLVSTSPLGGEHAAIERLVHENAVAGVALSAVALGRGADVADIDRLALLGQGHRRVLASSDDAERVVDEELHASSRAVARAVRLRVRLAPGVRLVDVVGAERLGERQAERVRESERSIDRRMARNLGIRADRGEDEEGVQIVIPSFYAGDTHVVLLDVVTDGPGPVADARVRYKDLVYRRNGVASARLDVASGRRPPGPLERNVLKNELAHVFAETARRASTHLAAGDDHAALGELRDMRTLLRGLRLVVPGWQRDPELGRDETLLAEFTAALGSAGGGGARRARLADALRYTAHRRLVPAWE